MKWVKNPTLKSQEADAPFLLLKETVICNNKSGDGSLQFALISNENI
jgi:hypothetical protein